MKAIGIARVSDPSQDDGQSTPAQVRRVTEYASQRGLDLAEIHEITESSTKDTRKKFEVIIKQIRESSVPIALLADTIDRVQRSFRESIELAELLKKGKLELHFLRENLILNKDSNSADLLRWDMGVMFARSYVLQLSDNVKRASEQKVRSGEWPEKAPCGYRNVELENGKKWIEVDRDRAPLIVKAFELYSTGQWSFKALAKHLAELGLTTNTKSQRPMYTSHLERYIIKNPFYYGEMEYKGKRHPHNYETLIPKWLYYKCEQVLLNWGKKPYKWGGKDFVFKGLLECSKCGSMLSSYEQKEFIYVRCHNCKAVHCREDKLLKQASVIFASMTLPEAVVEDLTGQLRKGHETERDFYEQNVSRIQKELGKLTNRKSVMYLDRLDGRITHDEYDKLIVQTKTREEKLHDEMRSHSKADETFLISCSYLLELLKRASDLFERSQPSQKNQLLRFVLANAKVDGEKLVWDLKSPFSGIVQCVETKEWLGRRDSNPRMTGSEPVALPLGDSPIAGSRNGTDVAEV